MGQGVVIIGAGQSGFSVAARLRALGYAGPVTLVGQEPRAPYQRPPLSKKFLLGQLDEAGVSLRPASFYPDQKIDLRVATEATQIDADQHLVHLSDGSVIGYDALVLATGARARPLRDDQAVSLAGIHTLRTLSDAMRLSAQLFPGRRLVVIGGGFVGLETAASARQAGLEVAVIEQSPRILQRAVGELVSQRLRQLHESHGVRILEHRAMAALMHADGRVTAVQMADGEELPADLVLVGIGGVPNTELAQAAGVAVGDGILVDVFGRTSVPGIYACGDCTRFAWGQDTLRLESVHNAIAQAECVAQAIAGQPVAYAPKPWFWSDQYDCKLQMAGLPAGSDSFVVRDAGTGPVQGVSVWYFSGTRLQAVEALNDSAAFVLARRCLDQGRSPRPQDIADTRLALKDLPLS